MPESSTTAVSTLQRWQLRFGDAIDSEVRRWVDELVHPASLATMLKYQMGYVDDRGNSTSAGGKRFRPILSLVACEAVGGDWRLALPLAAAVELLHNFSLIHDDIEDGDPIRHHRPTVWKVWGEPLSINAGDAMFALAARVVMEVSADPKHVMGIHTRFQEVGLNLTTGQHLDMSFERDASVSPESYLEMISLKTGAIIAYALWAGATVGGGDQATCRRFHAFGSHLGRAFQIYDDLMGIWGSSRATGKAEARDLENGKKTLPILLAAQQATGANRSVIDAYLAGSPIPPEEVCRVLTAMETEVLARDQLRHYLSLAQQDLLPAAVPSPGIQELLAFAGEITGERRTPIAGS